MELALQNNNVKAPRKSLFSKPLLLQSIKANWVFWLVLTLANALMIGVINVVMGTQNIGKAIDLLAVNDYLSKEGWNWLQALGLFQAMGFSLTRIQAMTSLDMNAVFNDLIYSIAGILLPMIYIIVTSNKLVAAQIDNGSMAYVLSTPTNRKKVIRTQFAFLVFSLLFMFLFVGAVAILTEYLGYGPSRAIPLRTFLFNVGAFCVGLGFVGVSFFASCFFSRARSAIAVGGGFCVFSYLAKILGLFGSKAFVASGLGVSGMKIFNYVTILNLFDCESISKFSKYVTGYPNSVIDYVWIFKLLVLVAICAAGYIGGSIVFKKKDLPL